MNHFTVVWHKDAEDELANVWVEAARVNQENSVTAAADLIEKLLREAPHVHGQHISEGLWKIYRHPLKVYFSVNEPDWIVRASNLCLIPPEEQDRSG